MATIFEYTQGQWPRILTSLAGLTAEQVTDTHQPCPLCGGKDRYRFDDIDGEGTWFCNKCGGPTRQGGAGNGWEMLMRKNNLSFPQALDVVSRHFGLTNVKPEPQVKNAERIWHYNDELAVARIKMPHGKKSYRQLYYDAEAWIYRLPPKYKKENSKPLLYLGKIRATADWVLVVEGEKTCDAAAKLFPHYACTTWSGGCKSHGKTDFSPLKGRKILLWPDADEEGINAMRAVADKLLRQGAIQVRIVTPPNDSPKGWDLADATWSPQEAADYISSNYRELTDPQPSVGEEGDKRIAPLLAAVEAAQAAGIQPGPHSSSEPEKRANEAYYTERTMRLASDLRLRFRADHTASNLWHGYLDNHWQSGLTNCDFKYALNRLYNDWGWVHRDSGTRRSDLENLRAELGPEMGKPNRNLVPFTNGLLDLTKGMDSDLLPHDPSHWNRYCLPFDYDPKAAPPKTIIWFLKDCLGHEEVIAMYRAFVWHVLMGKPMKCFLEITGPGDSGKSILAMLLSAAIGYANTVAIDMERLESSGYRFETYKLRGARLLVCSESQGYMGKVEMMKAITGGDRIPAEMKHGVKQCDFVFRGGFVYTGNSPIQLIDSTSAAVNRRRSIRCTKVIPKTEQRDLLLRDDEAGTYEGEFVSELGAFVKWCLEMDPAEARRALSGDVTSLVRAETDKEVLLTSDPLARWANANLVFAEDTFNSVGGIKDKGEPRRFLLANYLVWREEYEPKAPEYSQHNFKKVVVSLLRDTLRLPLPPGQISKGRYRERDIGSVVPCVRVRAPSEPRDVPGVVDFAFGRMVSVTTRNEPVHEETPVGNDRNEGNEEFELGDKEPQRAVEHPSGTAEVRKSRSARSVRSPEASQGELLIPGSFRLGDTGSGFDVEAG